MKTLLAIVLLGAAYASAEAGFLRGYEGYGGYGGYGYGHRYYGKREAEADAAAGYLTRGYGGYGYGGYGGYGYGLRYYGKRDADAEPGRKRCNKGKREAGRRCYGKREAEAIAEPGYLGGYRGYGRVYGYGGYG